MLCCIWRYTAYNENFLEDVPKDHWVLIARFMASLWMHTYLEMDETQGLLMMKYAVNHHENFANPYAAFYFGFVTNTMWLFLEALIIILLTSKTNVLDCVLAYTSFYPITNIPVYYFNDCYRHKIKKCSGMTLKFRKFRKDNPLEKAPCTIKCMRVIYKTIRTLHTSFIYYFMPFAVIFMNYKFMIADKSCNPMFQASCAHITPQP